MKIRRSIVFLAVILVLTVCCSLMSSADTVDFDGVALKNSYSTGKPQLSWDKVEGAVEYRIYRAVGTTSYLRIHTTSNQSFADASAVAGDRYYYYIVAVDADNRELCTSVTKNITCDLPRPVITEISNKTQSGKISLKWSSVSGAEKYEVYRADSRDGTYKKTFTTTSTSYTNTSAKAGEKYYYKVKAIHSDPVANSAYSPYKYRTCNLPRPTITKISNNEKTGKITLEWSKVEGAKEYKVYRATKKDGSYKSTFTTTGNTYTNTSAKAGTKYYYKVKAIHRNSDGNSALSAYKLRTCDLPRPSVTLSNVESTGKIKLTWKAVDGAESYKVYRLNPATNKWSSVFTTEGTKYTNTSAKVGNEYSYKVKAIHKNSEANSAYSEIETGKCLPVIRLSESYMKVKKGGTKTLDVTIASGMTEEDLVWKSSDRTVATVKNGLITGKKNGTVTITCSTKSGEVKDSCKIKVCNLKQVALTFDDGPSSAYTDDVLDLLKKYDINATFFLVGNRISTDPGAVKRMAREGHEIGYHTWAHEYFYNMSARGIKSDYNKFQKAVKNASGIKATVYRAPGGGITNTALDVIPLPHIMWSVDTRDWETRDTYSVKWAIINNLGDGDIILLHDIHGTTYSGTKAALDYVFDNDLDVEFMTVTELLSRDGTPPKAGKTYYCD